VSKLRRTLEALGIASSSPALGADEDANTRLGSADPTEARRTRETTPGHPPEVPDAIRFDLESGMGWPRIAQPGRLAAPGRGPLVVRRDSAQR